MMKRTVMTMLAATVLAGMAMPAAAADVRAAGRALAEQVGPAVIRVNVVIGMKASFGGQQGEEQEQEGESSGTIIGADGLTLVPLSEIDPATMVRNMMGGEASSEYNFESRVKKLEMIMPDGKEVPATVVLRDSDLDVALLRPTEALAGDVAHVDLTATAEPELLEEVVVLARMGRIANRQIGAMTGEVQAIVRRPRTFYVPHSELATGGLGTPVFNGEQKLIGFTLMRVMQGGRGSGFDSGESMLPVILPAEEVRKIAEGAPASGSAPATEDAATTTGTASE